MSNKKKIYFASDFHLGVPGKQDSKEREKQIVRWLSEIQPHAKEIFLVGDIFDFWFEYKHTIPKGYVRLLGKLAELTDSGIPVHFFTGNHDMWAFDYLPCEVGVQIHREPIIREFSGKKFMIGHGDGLGPGDKPYKMLKKIFSNKLCQWMFARIHPNLGISIANYWSKKSRLANMNGEETFLGEEKEWLIQFCRSELARRHIDYFIFGHRHLPIKYHLSENAQYINLGEWLFAKTYAVFDGNDVQLVKYPENQLVNSVNNASV
ncbi:MAG: UDP-2,3-diacylglucosamine diphosphatase [Bacteroidetes bacterium]|nr:MAG: UDP-2,3-diacylglucosamine diphosphatase [Bacteroidota bacterium]